MADSADNYRPARERSRSPRRNRSRSAGRAARRRSFSPKRSRSGSREEYRRGRDRSPMAGTGAPAGDANPPFGGSSSRSFDERSVARDNAVNNIRESSQQDRRVYVGNLSYDVKWHHLKDFMRQAGEVLYADVLMLPNGMSKGCGIVEYATREQAQTAVATLSNQNLMGRLVYVREDREPEPRFSNQPGGGGGGGGGMRPGFGPAMQQQTGYNNYGGGPVAPGHGSRQIYVSNLPYQVGWQDLKDLFRGAARHGAVIRADVHIGADGRPKGSGIVVYENADDARNAIQQFNGYDWQGRMLEVREDRFAGGGGGMPYGGMGRGPPFAGRGNFGGGFGRGVAAPGIGRGGFGYGGGGRGGGFGAGPGPGPASFDQGAGGTVPPNPFTDFATAGSEKSETIFVGNLPWSTSNDDLIELFTTIGKVEQAEIQYEPTGRSKGAGVVRFDTADNAETAITKFQGYQYGGRPLKLNFVKYISPAGGGDPMDTDPHAGLTQDQIM